MATYKINITLETELLMDADSMQVALDNLQTMGVVGILAHPGFVVTEVIVDDIQKVEADE